MEKLANTHQAPNWIRQCLQYSEEDKGLQACLAGENQGMPLQATYSHRTVWLVSPIH